MPSPCISVFPIGITNNPGQFSCCMLWSNQPNIYYVCSPMFVKPVTSRSQRRTLPETSIFPPWCFHGIERCLYDVFMDSHGCFHGSEYVLSRFFHGLHGAPMVISWCCMRFMVLPWRLHGASMVLSWSPIVPPCLHDAFMDSHGML